MSRRRAAKPNEADLDPAQIWWDEQAKKEARKKLNAKRDKERRTAKNIAAREDKRQAEQLTPNAKWYFPAWLVRLGTCPGWPYVVRFASPYVTTRSRLDAYLLTFVPPIASPPQIRGRTKKIVNHRTGFERYRQTSTWETPKAKDLGFPTWPTSSVYGQFLVAKSLEGEQEVAVASLPEAPTRCLTFELGINQDHFRRLLTALSDLGVVSPLSFRSDNKIHVYVPLEELVTFYRAHALCFMVLERAGLSREECRFFPDEEGTSVRLPGTKNSNLIYNDPSRMYDPPVCSTSKKNSTRNYSIHRHEQLDEVLRQAAECLSACPLSNLEAALRKTHEATFDDLGFCSIDDKKNDQMIEDLYPGWFLDLGAAAGAQESSEVTPVTRDCKVPMPVQDPSEPASASSTGLPLLPSDRFGLPSIWFAGVKTADVRNYLLKLMVESQRHRRPLPPVFDSIQDLPRQVTSLSPTEYRKRVRRLGSVDPNAHSYRPVAYQTLLEEIYAGVPAPGCRNDYLVRWTVGLAQYVETAEEIRDIMIDAWIKTNGGQSNLPKEDPNHVEVTRKGIYNFALKLVEERRIHPLERAMRRKTYYDNLTEADRQKIRQRTQEKAAELGLDGETTARLEEAAIHLAPRLMSTRSKTAGTNGGGTRIHSFIWIDLAAEVLQMPAEDVKRAGPEDANGEKKAEYVRVREDMLLPILNAARCAPHVKGVQARCYRMNDWLEGAVAAMDPIVGHPFRPEKVGADLKLAIVTRLEESIRGNIWPVRRMAWVFVRDGVVTGGCPLRRPEDLDPWSCDVGPYEKLWDETYWRAPEMEPGSGSRVAMDVMLGFVDRQDGSMSGAASA